ncbi:permease-like cell division protein FtsX [soil metagenome]
MRVWLREHRFAFSHALRHSFKARSGFLLNVLVVAIALALPFAGLTLLENVRPVSEQLAVDPEISVFMAMDVPREKATAVAQEIRGVLQEMKVKAKLEFVPREKALEALKGKTGLSDALTTLGSNPLPDGYVLKLAGFRNATEAGQIDAVVARLKTLAGIESVQVDSAWVKRLAALLNVLRLALIFLALALGVVVIAVVFNTIRLQVLNQRDEIEVSRLVGATDAFISRPFYYTGAILGLCAGVLGLAIVFLALHPMNAAIVEFAQLYGSAFLLSPLGALQTLELLAISATLGLLGSLFSVHRHLKRLTRPV